MRNTVENVKQKLISRYLEKSNKQKQVKSTDINVLLNRVRLDKKKYKMGDHKNLLCGMTCSLNKKDMNKIKTFYYNI